MNICNLLGGIAACAFVATTVFGAAGAANAGPEYTTCGGGCAGSWEKAGQDKFRFELKDVKKDGFGVTGYVFQKSNGALVAEHYLGEGGGQSITFTHDGKPGELEGQMCTVDGPEHKKKVCSDKMLIK